TTSRPCMGRPVPRQCMRNAWLDWTTLVPATASHRRSDAERYSRSTLSEIAKAAQPTHSPRKQRGSLSVLRAHPRLRIGVQRDLMQCGDHLPAQERQGAHDLCMRDVPVAADQDEISRAEMFDGRGQLPNNRGGTADNDGADLL